MTHTLARLRRRFSRRPEQTTTVTLHVDHSAFSEQLARLAESWQIMQRNVGRALGPALIGFAETIGRFAQALSPVYAANQPVHVAGLEARYLVRAGLDPAYADPAALNVLVQSILTGSGDLQWVSDENRTLIAAAAIRGWVGSYAGSSAVTVLAWHRKLGDTAISVGRAS